MFIWTSTITLQQGNLHLLLNTLLYDVKAPEYKR